MTVTKAESDRRRAILVAARECFMQFGFAKTSFADIARVAGISRPLIYLHFKSKEELVAADFARMFEERYPAVERAIAGGGTTRERLMRVYELLLLEPWAEVMRSPMAAEFHAACEALIPDAEDAYQKRRVRYTQAVLGERDLAVVFSMAADGLQADLPSVGVLRKRLARLVERFS